MANKIIDFLTFKTQRENRKKVNLNKWYAVRSAVIKFYEDKALADGVNIPAFILADTKMKEVIKNEKDLNHYYGLLKKYGGA